MPRGHFLGSVVPYNNVAGPVLANSTTLTDISPGVTSGAPYKIPANFLEIGMKVWLKAWGEWSTTTGPPNLLLGFYYGGVAGVALAATTAYATTASLTSVPWELEYFGIVRSVGTGGANNGQIQGQGTEVRPTSLVARTPRNIPEVAASRVVSIDTTIEKLWSVGAQWGTANAANTITCNGFNLELD